MGTTLLAPGCPGGCAVPSPVWPGLLSEGRWPEMMVCCFPPPGGEQVSPKVTVPTQVVIQSIWVGAWEGSQAALQQPGCSPIS